MSYDPNCLHCRRDAGKDAAGVTQLCEAHKDAEIARLEHELAGQRDGEAQEIVILRHKLDNALEKLAEREATVDILVSRVHERDAELGELKRTGKTERGFTNDYIKALHKAESRLRAAEALVREVEWSGANLVRNSGYCIACGNECRCGHESDCRLAAWLDPKEGR